MLEMNSDLILLASWDSILADRSASRVRRRRTASLRLTAYDPIRVLDSPTPITAFSIADTPLTDL
jgi:hypothetical protein